MSVDHQERVFYSSDLFKAGLTPEFVAASANSRRVAELVKLAAAEHA